MKNVFQNLPRKNSRFRLKKINLNNIHGYTLTEILVAGLLSAVVLSISGMGIVSLMSASRANNAKSERRVEIDRSLGFITSEIQQAFQVNAVNVPVPDNKDADNEQSVFQLTIPGLANPIIYYTANPTNTWLGPKVIYRWGPGYDPDFNYDKTAPSSSWEHQPLIDLMEDAPQLSVGCYVDPADSSKNWTQTPSSTPAGLYGCIDPTRRIVKIFHQGRVYTTNAHQVYTAEEQAFARASTGLDPFQNFQISQGRLLLPSSSRMQFEVLGSDLRCGASGIPVDTQLVINISSPNVPQSNLVYRIAPNNPNLPILTSVSLGSAGISVASTGNSISINSSLPIGTSLDFTGLVPNNNINNTCDLQNISNFLGFNSVSHPNQVKVFKDGDIIPPIGAFGGGAIPIEVYARNYLQNAGGQYKVTINNSRQAIILFELGVTNTSSSAFDLQDIVLLATVNP
jgi:hypothetical protein